MRKKHGTMIIGNTGDANKKKTANKKMNNLTTKLTPIKNAKTPNDAGP